MHKIRSEAAREHPGCFGPHQHKIQLKNSYTSPALSQLYALNGGDSNGTAALLEMGSLESSDTDSLASWNETQHQLESCGTHSYCEETGCLQNPRLDKAGLQLGKSSNSGAIRTDSSSCGSPARLVSQGISPLPVHPCVIVDTRDPLSVTSDLLGNDVRIEWVDSCSNLEKAWNATDLAQDHRALTATESHHSDILGISSGPQITLSSLFGGDTQPVLCSTVNILPQKVRIVPNMLHLPVERQMQEDIPHGQNLCNSQTGSQFVASLSSGNSQPCTVSPNEPELPRPVGFSWDFMRMAPRLNSTSKAGVKEVQEVGEESWELLSPPGRTVGRDPLSSPPVTSTNSFSHGQTGAERSCVEQLIETGGLGLQPQSRVRSFRSQHSRWGLPEAEVRMWGAQILLALESLHEQGIVCQDLNPRNVLLSSSGECITVQSTRK